MSKKCLEGASAREPFYEAFGRALRGRREELRLTQTELGERLQPHLTHASIANIEAGRQRVLIHTFVELADALRLTPAELLGDCAIFTRAAEIRRRVDELRVKRRR